MFMTHLLTHFSTNIAENASAAPELSFTQVHGLQKFLVKAIKGVDADTVVEPVLVETYQEITEQIFEGAIIGRQMLETLRGIHTPDGLFDLVERLKATLFDSSNSR